MHPLTVDIKTQFKDLNDERVDCLMRTRLDDNSVFFDSVAHIGFDCYSAKRNLYIGSTRGKAGVHTVFEI